MCLKSKLIFLKLVSLRSFTVVSPEALAAVSHHTAATPWSGLIANKQRTIFYSTTVLDRLGGRESGMGVIRKRVVFYKQTVFFVITWDALAGLTNDDNISNSETDAPLLFSAR